MNESNLLLYTYAGCYTCLCNKHVVVRRLVVDGNSTQDPEPLVVLVTAFYLTGLLCQVSYETEM